MKRLAVCIICCAMGFLSFSQDRCGVGPRDEVQAERFEIWLKAKQQERIAKGIDGTQKQNEVYYLPVVFHIIHQGENVGVGDNISDERIIEQVEILNEDFRRMNRRRNTGVPAVFSDVEADIEVEFVLARQDPDGLPTNGIVRVIGDRPKYSDDDVKSFSYWPSEDYLNIWVANTYPSIYGWASFPDTDLPGNLDTETDPTKDGVVIDSEYIGVNPLASGEFESFGQTVTHEIGHFLGLLHIWGGTSCFSDDHCADTPAQSGSNGGLSNCSYPGFDSCDSDAFADMFMNFLDYSDDQCMTMFTEDQKIRMRTVLENSPRRLSLRSSPGLDYPLGALDFDITLSGVSNLPIVTCDDQVEVQLSIRNLGNQIITDLLLEYHLEESSESQFIDGLSLEMGESTTISVSLSFTSEGQKILNWSVLEINGESDENTLNNSASSFTVVNTDEQSAPFREDFEGGIWATNSINGTSEWQTHLLEEENILSVEAFESNSEIESWLISPIFSLQDFEEAGLFFKMSYGINSEANTNDILRMLVSTSCSDEFTEVWSRNLGLLDFEETSSAWTPDPKENWLEQFIDLSNFVGEDELRLAFVFENNGGNNFFLDDIELTNNSDADQPRLQEGKAVAYPNPARESLKVTLSLPESQDISVQLVDISGSVVFKERYPDILNQTLTFQTGSLFGTYFLILKGKDINKIQRVLIGR